MKRSIIVVIGIAIFVVVIGLVSTTFVMSRYQLSLPTLINKVATKFSLIEGGELLISPKVKYAQTSIQDMVVQQYPRILATQLNRWNAVISPEYFTQRVDMIKRQRLGFTFNCTSNTLGNLLNCYVNDPSERSFEALVAGLNSFEFIKPTVNDSKSNAWLFAFVVDVVMTSDKLRGGQRRQLDQWLRSMLNHYLVMLDDDWASLWHSRSTLSAQAFLLATVLDRSAQQNQQLYRRALGHFHQTYQALASTEVWPEGYNYWINNRALLAVLAMSAYANSHQLSMDRAKIISTIKRIGLVHIYQTRPDFKIEGWADEGPRIDLKDETAKVIDLIAQITQDQVFYQFARAIRQRYGEESYYRSYRWMLPWLYAPDKDAFGLSGNTDKKSKKQLLLPLSPLLPNSALFGKNMVNQMVVRSGWGDDDTFISYRAGHIFTHHQHYDAGHFSVYKGAPLLVNSSQYNGSVLSLRRLNIDIRTNAKNTLLVQNADEVVKPNHLFDDNVAAGGQRLIMPTGSALVSFEHWRDQRDNGLHLGAAKLISYKFEPDVYTAISSDLTSAYNSVRYSSSNNDAKVKQVVRHLVYLNQYDLLFTYDRVLTTQAAFKTKWLAHMANKPLAGSLKRQLGFSQDGIFATIASKFIVTNGDSKLTLNILSPPLSNTVIIGGEKYQHYIESDGDDTELNGSFYSQGFNHKTWYDLARWRIEVSPLNQTEITRYVIAMQPQIKGLGGQTLKVNALQHTSDGVAQLGPLIVLWPHEGTKWQFSLLASSEQMILFLDNAQRLVVNVEGTKEVMVIQGKAGFNLIDKSFTADSHVIITREN